ncbi:ribonuclease N [Streptomyces sp. NBC_01239]|uniref:ribonuclease domain-containing protein n=1 Tax=Streptomyces sp. NBC_01239 TaxID=2903792 RepID=UPI00224FBFE1|nr:ribonuclease domain-containing protein [Streptomyces sp. NBC_01239]MCX4809651.1 ribonuclease N [Streptomyces sp. NBC_01239]
MLLRFVSRVLLVFLAVLLPVGCSSTATTGAGTTATVELSRLPAEARRTVALIDQGGPFPYAKDGVVFGNYEKLLPRQKRGFYHEYTVSTPGSRDRGARRIVTGQDGEIYYTDDHYKSFRTVLR